MRYFWAIITSLLVPAGPAAAASVFSQDLLFAINADFSASTQLLPEIPDIFVAAAGTFTIDRDLVPESGSVLLPLSVIENFSFQVGSFSISQAELQGATCRSEDPNFISPTQPCRIVLNERGEARLNDFTRLAIFNPGGSRFVTEIFGANDSSRFDAFFLIQDPTTPFPGLELPTFPAFETGEVRFLGPVPEPSTWGILGLGGLVVAWAVRRRRAI